MDLLTGLLTGFATAFTPLHLALAILGCVLGTLVGALPGLGPSNGVAILVPLAFSLGLDATATLILLTSVYYGAMYGGRISSILLAIPGDEPALMTILDGHPMARAGRAGEALALSGLASFVGGVLATAGLVLLAPLLARFALLFGPAEYFALYVLAFATLGGLAARNPMKALFAAALGLALALVGYDTTTGIPRYTFGLVELYEGIDFLVAIVGLFALSEVFIFVEKGLRELPHPGRLGRIFVRLSTLRQSLGAMFRGTGIGFLAGVLPGAGASLGSFLAYMLEKRVSDSAGTFGRGDPRGVAAPEAGNNAAAGGALVPMLTLGVPGSGTTAVLLAVLMALDITPGPLLFEQRPEVVWGLVAALFFANLVLLALNLPLVGLFVQLLRVPPRYLMPLVAMVSFVGIHAISNNPFDLQLMIGFGVLGWVLRKLEVPLVPIILGILLGNEMEDNLRRALLIADGDWTVLWRSPLAAGLWTVALLGFFGPMLVGPWLRRRRARLLEGRG